MQITTVWSEQAQFKADMANFHAIYPAFNFWSVAPAFGVVLSVLTHTGLSWWSLGRCPYGRGIVIQYASNRINKNRKINESGLRDLPKLTCQWDCDSCLTYQGLSVSTSQSSSSKKAVLWCLLFGFLAWALPMRKTERASSSSNLMIGMRF